MPISSFARSILYKRADKFDPYVVHYESENEPGDRWTGGYFSSIVEAAQEFEARCKKNCVRDASVTRFATVGGE